MTKGSHIPVKNLHFSTVLSVHHARSDERVVKSTGAFPAPRTENEYIKRPRRFSCAVFICSLFSSLSLVFEDRHHFSRTLGSVSRQSLKTAITSAELWAVFEDSLERQASLQHNFGQSLMTAFKDSHHFSTTLGSL